MENTIKNLAQIEAINDRINTVTTDAITALHKFIFGEKILMGDHEKRQNLRNFEGFSFEANTPEYIKKLQDAQQLTIRDFIDCCDIFGLEHNILESITQICKGFINLDTLLPVACDRVLLNFVDSVIQTKFRIIDRLDIASDDAVESLHKFIFGIKGISDRKWYIKKFKGFHFDKYDKRRYEIMQRFTISDFINYHEFIDFSVYDINDLIILMCNGLMDLNTLVSVPNNHYNTENNETSMKVSVQIFNFNGNNAYPVEKWITDIEDVATLLKLTEKQKLMLAKMLLTGLAKMWIKDKGNVKTWSTLKIVLKELSSEINNNQLYKNLANRKMRKNEKIQDYYEAMKQLAQNKTKPGTLIQYVINGIPHDANKKAILYGATDFEDFSKKLKLYETIGKEEVETIRCQEEE